MQKEELSIRVKEYKETIEKQEGQIEEMERRIKVLEADLEAAEDDSEENKKYANQQLKARVYIIIHVHRKLAELEFSLTTLTNDFKAKESSETKVCEDIVWAWYVIVPHNTP